ncbi:NAD(P)-dependent alcohol dehydrogenase [Haliea sp. E17]|uniref:NAD(P)-dependent alcohol dehydrogenase n=1 Tax=Haliea sp. E17 TaxID=3401576 RepID=UPI003AAE7F7D
MKEIQAAVLWPGKRDLALEQLAIEAPREGEVLVRVVATGICHTDMVLRDAGITPRPVVLGHEGAGVVEEVGPGVSGFAAGDRVAISFAACGSCRHCEQDVPGYCEQFFPLNFFGARLDGSCGLEKDGEKVHSHVFGQSSFASHCLCPAASLVKVEEDFPLELAGPFGCGFQTGAGAVLNSLKVPAGASIAVLGAGAVGLAAVAAARHIAGAATVIAVDIHQERLEVAAAVGASHSLVGTADDLQEQVMAASPGGVDYVIDTTGKTAFAERWVPLLAARGTLALVASYPPEDAFSFNTVSLMTSGKKIVGVMEGDSDIVNFIPSLMAHFQAGRFPVDKLVRFYDLAEINQAIEDSERGATIKAIVRMPD